MIDSRVVELKRLAIVTPVYNREGALARLYHSLCQQKSFDFCWYVVDDGSSDGTLGAARSFACDGVIEIAIFSKANGGKHTAVNHAMRYVKEPLTMIVDSDDWLPPDAVETIVGYFEKIEGEVGLSGISFLREMANASNARMYPLDEMRGTYADVRLNRRVSGDKAEVYYTEVLRRYPFPEFAGEKFYHEDGVWISISEKYEMLFVNKVVYCGAYQEDGLTRGGRKIKMASPLGMVDRSFRFLSYPYRLIPAVLAKHSILYSVYGAVSGHTFVDLFKACPRKLLFLMMWIPSKLVRFKWGA